MRYQRLVDHPAFLEIPMDIDATAPVITRDEILINAPLAVVWKTQTDIASWPRWRPEVPTARFEGELTVGSVFHWEEGGLQIASTVREINPRHRLVWDGTAQGIYAIHVWQFSLTADGTLVQTQESWSGGPVREQAANLQPLLDRAIRTWLTNLIRAAEQGRERGTV
ncbi:MAG TPA: SRPBCC family protein [Verrucomicrobiae bacterium]|nr:SRPBCC family protein [Verrucomicrobiae bacterium]